MSPSNRFRVLRVERLSERLPLATFGFDSRIAVPADQLKNPIHPELFGGLIGAHAGIAQLISDRDASKTLSSADALGTAFLISPNYALTAAHVVLSKTKSGQLLTAQPGKMFLRFGWDGRSAHTGIVGVKQIHMPDAWKAYVHSDDHAKGIITHAATLNDYALLELDQNIGSRALVAFYPCPDNPSPECPKTTRSLVDNSQNSNPAGTNQLFVSGHPTDAIWSSRGYPQVISTGPGRWVNGIIHADPVDVSAPNPWSVLIERLPGESASSYNARTERFRETSGLDTFRGMSGGPVWVWSDRGTIINHYQFVGLTSSSSDNGNNFTPVTDQMIANLNRWTRTVGNGSHFALEPLPSVEHVPIISHYDDLFGTNESRAPQGIVPIYEDAPNGFANDAIFVDLRLYNRGLSAAEDVKISFYLSTDDVVDPSTDTLLETKWVNLIEPQSSPFSAASRFRLPISPEIPRRTDLYLGWIIETHADPEGDRGVFPGPLSLEWAPTIRTPNDFHWNVIGPEYGTRIYEGQPSEPQPILLTDREGDVDRVVLQAYAATDTARLQPLPWVQFQGTGANRTARVTAPPGFAAHGLTWIDIVATDDQGTMGSQPGKIAVFPVPQNFPPFIERIPDFTVREGEVIRHAIQVSDSDGPPGEILVGDLNCVVSRCEWPGANVFFTTYEYVPTEQDGGRTFRVEIGAADAASPPAISSRVFQVTVLESNVAPVFDSIDRKTAAVGTEVSFTVQARDADLPANTLIFSAPNLPSGAHFQADTKTFRWTPSLNQGGEHSIQFTVFDGTESASITVPVQVTGTNVWHNYLEAWDVNGDTVTTAMDALVIINRINAGLLGKLPNRLRAEAPFLDVNGDGNITPMDVLLVVNRLNSSSQAEGEPLDDSPQNVKSVLWMRSIDHFFLEGAWDESWSEDDESDDPLCVHPRYGSRNPARK